MAGGKNKKRKKGIRYDRLFIMACVLGLIIWGIAHLFTSCFGETDKPAQTPEETKQTAAATETVMTTVTTAPEPIKPTQYTCGVNNILTPTEDIDIRAYENVTLDSADIHKGLLILINAANEFVFPEKYDPALLAENNNGSFRVKDYTVFVDNLIVEPLNRMLSDYTAANSRNILVCSGYRTYDYQKYLYENDLDATGLGYSTLTALPGHSEHHSGFAVDFTIRTESGLTRTYDGTGNEKWINENCHKYGFIERYPADKAAVTGIDYEPWHFRYVGLPHSIAVMENGGCYEEYIEMLKQYEFGKKHLGIYADGKVYEVYYMKAEEATTTLYVPTAESGREYVISGNNTDGFIVTVSVS